MRTVQEVEAVEAGTMVVIEGPGTEVEAGPAILSGPSASTLRTTRRATVYFRFPSRVQCIPRSLQRPHRHQSPG